MLESITFNIGFIGVTFNKSEGIMLILGIIVAISALWISIKLYNRHTEFIHHIRYCPECKALTMLKVDDTYDTETNSIPVYVYECPACGCNKEIPHDC